MFWETLERFHKIWQLDVSKKPLGNWEEKLHPEKYITSCLLWDIILKKMPYRWRVYALRIGAKPGEFAVKRCRYIVQRMAPDYELRFCDEKAMDWIPDPARFPDFCGKV